jgi:hypothetical protein
MKTLLATAFGLSSLLLAQSAFADESGWQTVPGAPPPLPAEPEPLPSAAPPPAATPVATTTTTSATVLPQEQKDQAPAAQPAEVETRALQPLQIDLRMGLNTNPVLAYIGFGLAADLGVAKTGPGTIAIGAGWEHSACATSCWEFQSATPYMDYSERQNWAQARASYHLPMRGIPRLDLYPLLSMGPVLASSTVDLDGGATRYRGRVTTIGIGLGGGLSYTVYGPLFVGAEARIRYAGGNYEYTLINGRDKSFDRASVESFSLTGLDAFLAFGARLP